MVYIIVKTKEVDMTYNEKQEVIEAFKSGNKIEVEASPNNWIEYNLKGVTGLIANMEENILRVKPKWTYHLGCGYYRADIRGDGYYEVWSDTEFNQLDRAIGNVHETLSEARRWGSKWFNRMKEEVEK